LNRLSSSQDLPQPPIQMEPKSNAILANHLASIDKIAFLNEAKVDEELRRGFISYQYQHFRMLSQGALTDIQKMRHMRQLKPGEVLESDEVLAMSLEDRMVSTHAHTPASLNKLQ